MTKTELLDSIPSGGMQVFACNDINDEKKLLEFNNTKVKLIYELRDDGQLEIINTRRENTTGYSYISLLQVQRN